MNKIASLVIACLILALFIGASWFITRDTGVAVPDETAAAGVAAQEEAGVRPAPLWVKRCNEQQPPHCELFQRLSVRETGQRLIEVAIGFPAGADRAQVGLILPLGIAVAEGIRLRVDDQDTALSLPVQSCGSDGCMAIAMVDEAFVNDLRLGKILAVDMLDSQGQRIRIQLSLSDFAEGFATLR